MNLAYNRGIWNATKTWPSDWRAQVFVNPVFRKESIEVTVFAVIDDVEVRVDYEVNFEALGGEPEFTEEEGYDLTLKTKHFLDSEIGNGVISRIKEKL